MGQNHPPKKDVNR